MLRQSFGVITAGAHACEQRHGMGYNMHTDWKLRRTQLTKRAVRALEIIVTKAAVGLGGVPVGCTRVCAGAITGQAEGTATRAPQVETTQCN